MLGWEKHKKFILGASLIILIWVGVYLLIMKPLRSQADNFIQKAARLKKEIEQKISEGKIKDQKAIRTIQQERERLEKKLAELKQKISFQSRTEYHLQADPKDQLVKFQKLLAMKQSILTKSASVEGITLPPSFGFPHTHIDPKDIPFYFRQLDLIEQILNLVIACKPQEISAIVVEKKDIKYFLNGVSLDDPYKKVEPVIIRLKAEFESILNLINHLIRSPRFLSIVKLSLEKTEPETKLITLTLVIGGVKPTREVEQKN